MPRRVVRCVGGMARGVLHGVALPEPFAGGLTAADRLVGPLPLVVPMLGLPTGVTSLRSKGRHLGGVFRGRLGRALCGKLWRWFHGSFHGPKIRLVSERATVMRAELVHRPRVRAGRHGWGSGRVVPVRPVLSGQGLDDPSGDTWLALQPFAAQEELFFRWYIGACRSVGVGLRFEHLET